MPNYYPPATGSGGAAGASSVDSAAITDGSIVNADINAAAAIALSKLASDPLARANHTGTQLLATISDAGTLAGLSAVASAQITDGTIVGGDLSGTIALPNGTTATTQSAADNSTKPATTAYVDTADALKANLASPTFTGTPTLPTGTIATTQSAADSSTKVATTAFTTTADNLKADLASPTFTGTPTLPTGTILTTQAASDSSTKAASTAYVKSQLALPPDSYQASINIYIRNNTTYGGQFCCITALKPIFVPVSIPGVPFLTLANLRFRVSTLNAAQTVGVAVYSATYASSAHVSATLVAQLNVAQTTAATGVFQPAVTTGAAGSGAATLAMDFTTTRYLLGVMSTDVTTAKCTGYVLPAADTGLGVISWTGTARSGTTDWPSSFTEAANIAAVSAATPLTAVDLLTATGAFFL